MSTHTPGPWYEHSDMWAVCAGTEGNETDIADIHGHDITHETRDANARLIATAPDLLAACEALLTIAVETGHGMSDAAIAARAAIEKARGNV